MLGHRNDRSRGFGAAVLWDYDFGMSAFAPVPPTLGANSGLTPGEKKLKHKRGKGTLCMRLCCFAIIAMFEPALVGGEGCRFSPDYKTRATKTTTKTV